MNRDEFIWRYSPDRTSPELLETIFVQREPLLQDLLERVAESATTGSKHHVLLIGARGLGKTHLLTLLNSRLLNNAALADRLRIAWLMEDETITSFVQLLKRTYEILAQQYPGEFPVHWLEELLDESPKHTQRQLQNTLIEAFREKTLLLCIENLDGLLSGMGAEGQHEWRAFLQEHPFTTIVATAQRIFEDVKSREKPFFGFFSPVLLNPLDVEEAVELLRRIAAERGNVELADFLNSTDGHSRVQALHHVAGGNHRIYVTLAGFITRDSLDELAGPFQRLADELTPHYQDRLRWLSPQQRQIVEFLCSQDHPCMPKQIARHLMAAENTISGQLRKLLEMGYLLRSERGRESLYELSDPLMRLAAEVKDQRRRPLEMLVEFLRVWYLPAEQAGARLSASSEPEAISAAITDVHGRISASNDAEPLREQRQRYAVPGELTRIGASLVRQLALIDREITTATTLRRWKDHWLEFGAQEPEMKIPLRLFSVGIEYLIRQDDRVLLDLVATERKILQQLPGLTLSMGS